ncbi:MAG: carboxylating nicotinate-nucleotide diphosphorylase [Endomicrobiales bacterium]
MKDRGTGNLIRLALAEDDARNDVTSHALVPPGKALRGRFIAKDDGVISGLEVAKQVFAALDRRCRMRSRLKDGGRVCKGRVFAEVTGRGTAVLSGERTALNFMQHLSGVATLTAKFVEKVKGTPAKIYDTRKTLPGFRYLDKYAVRCGGGVNHRMDLGEMALIKDNHLAMAGSMRSAVEKIRARKKVPVEIECENLSQVDEALEAGADILMLDNMDARTLKQAIARIRKSAEKSGARRPDIEISGGVSLKTVRAFARLGVDRISVGALTHSAPALDISLEFD